MAGSYNDRHGIPGAEVQTLSYKYYTMDGSDNWFGFDDFLLWCLDNGYQKGRRLRKIDRRLPYSKDNSYFYDKKMTTEQTEAAMQDKKDSCDFCRACTDVCRAESMNCFKWRAYFVKNWNEKICRRKNAVVKEDRDVFRYEHPDLVREGIVWQQTSQD